jgi:hypothetical protein
VVGGLSQPVACVVLEDAPLSGMVMPVMLTDDPAKSRRLHHADTAPYPTIGHLGPQRPPRSASAHLSKTLEVFPLHIITLEPDRGGGSKAWSSTTEREEVEP